MSEKAVYLLAGGPSSGAKLTEDLRAALAACGKSQPRVAYIGTANGEREAGFQRIYEALMAAGAACVTLVPILSEKATPEEAKRLLTEADVVFLSGGEVEDGMRGLEKFGLVDFLRGLYQNGTVFLGVSAGSIMLGQYWVHWDVEGDDSTARLFPCLGFVPFTFDAHGELEDWCELICALRLLGTGTTGYGLADGGFYRADSAGTLTAFRHNPVLFHHENGGVAALDRGSYDFALRPIIKSKLRVGIACNIKTDRSSDEQAEFDEPATIDAIDAALTAAGFDTVVLEATRDFPRKLMQEKPDIVFNITEGTTGRNRESQVPAMLEYYGIPYTGSDAATLSLALDKALAKQLVQARGVRTPVSFLARHAEDIPVDITFPVLVKPNGEGSSKGISDSCVAANKAELTALIRTLARDYAQELLVEQYIDGREFTVGLMGNGADLQVFAPMEIVYHKRRGRYNVYSYEVKQSFAEYVTYQCPPALPQALQAQMMDAAKTVYETLDCRDFARVDFRLSAENEIFFIEINPLPGLAPGYSDYIMIGAFNGIPYDMLIADVLRSALKRLELENTPQVPDPNSRAYKLFGVEEGAPQWNDWHWQYRNRIADAAELSRVLDMDAQEQETVSRCLNNFRMAITPYYASLIDPHDPCDPIRLQAVPSEQEMRVFPWEMSDPLNEEGSSPVRNIVHRYPDRALFMTTKCCATYCRHCTRRRFVGEEDSAISDEEIREAIDYIRRTPAIHDVLLSGGDPLTLSDERLDYILTQLRGIAHVGVIRIGTRMPVTMPMRITPTLLAVLQKHHPVWINTHFNHPRELTPTAVAACGRIADAGIPLGNQSVLLRGINDNTDTMKELLLGLVKARVRPYYLYQCDLSEGLEHFRTDVRTGIQIIQDLTGRLSGYAIPKLVIDAPGGGGKIPVNPDYLLTLDDEKAVLKNYRGDIYEYPQPCRDL